MTVFKSKSVWGLIVVVLGVLIFGVYSNWNGFVHKPLTTKETATIKSIAKHEFKINDIDYTRVGFFSIGKAKDNGKNVYVYTAAIGEKKKDYSYQILIDAKNYNVVSFYKVLDKENPY